MNKRRCPDCHTQLEGDRCCCGWQALSNPFIERQCVYTHGGRRCPRVGYVSFDTLPPRQWYCRDHGPYTDEAIKQHTLRQAYHEEEL